MTDAARIVTENTARFGGGSSIQKRWAELLDAHAQAEENRDPDEIIADIAEKAGLIIT